MAIAFDTSDGGRRLVNPGTSLTWGYTVTGTNTLLMVGTLISAATNNITGIVYNSVTVPFLNQIQTDSAANMLAVYGLTGASTGINNVTISISPSSTVQAHATSYAGVKQTGFPDNKTTGNVTTGTTQSFPLTTIADNCWIYTYNRSEVDNPATAGTNTAVRNTATSACTVADTNSAQTPAGSHSLSLTHGGSGNSWYSLVSFAPADGGSIYVPQLMSLRVG